MQHCTWTLRSFFTKICYSYRWNLLLMAVAMGGVAADWSLYTYIIKWIIDSFAAVQSAGIHVVYLPLSLYMIDATFATACYRAIDHIKARVQPGIEQVAAKLIFNHMLAHSHAFYQNYTMGSLVNKIDALSTGSAELVLLCIESFLFKLVTFALGLITLWHCSHLIGLIMTLWLGATIIAAYYFSGRLEQLSEQTADQRSTISGYVTDVLNNMVTVRTFNGFGHEQHAVGTLWSSWYATSRKRDQVLFHLYFMQGTVLWLIREALTLVVIVKNFGHGITLGDIALIFMLGNAFMMLTWSLTQEISRAIKLYGQVSQAFRELMVPSKQSVIGHQQLTVRAGALQFRNVFFGYDGTKHLFSALSLTISAGQRVGLVGPSGSGKTTLVNLLLRLYAPQRGVIMIDNQDIALVTEESLRAAIGFIPQDPSLFHRTLYENIAYGDFQASKDAVIHAARLARADEFIMALPDQYGTLVGDRGVKLSGGQRQRIAIARAFLKEAPILIMDEATSALDSQTELYIQKNIAQLGRNRTMIVIAHRLSTLLAMDRIIVLDQGTIVEDGSHAALIERKGVYWTLWNTQANGFLGDGSTE